MNHVLLHFANAPDPAVQALVDKVINIVAPILYAGAGGFIVFALVRFAIKLHAEPEKKAEWVKHLVWSLFAVMILLTVTIIAHVLLLDFGKLL